MDAWNLHGRKESAWTHGICMDAPLNLHAGVVEIVSGRFDQSSPVQPVVELGGGWSERDTHKNTKTEGWMEIIVSGEGIKKKIEGRLC